MEDNKIMTTEENYEVEPIATEEEAESQFGLGLLIGGVVAAGAIFAAKYVKELWKRHKDKEPQVTKTDPTVIDITPDVVESDEETE